MAKANTTLVEDVETIIKWSEENSSGILLNKVQIRNIIHWFYSNRHNLEMLEHKVNNCYCESGYLVKVSDFKSLVTIWNK